MIPVPVVARYELSGILFLSSLVPENRLNFWMMADNATKLEDDLPECSFLAFWLGRFYSFLGVSIIVAWRCLECPLEAA